MNKLDNVIDVLKQKCEVINKELHSQEIENKNIERLKLISSYETYKDVIQLLEQNKDDNIKITTLERQMEDKDDYILEVNMIKHSKPIQFTIIADALGFVHIDNVQRLINLIAEELNKRI